MLDDEGVVFRTGLETEFHLRMEMFCGYVFAMATLIWVLLTGSIKPFRDKDDLSEALATEFNDVRRAVADQMLLAAISVT